MTRERPVPPPLYAIADAEALFPRALPDAVAAMADAGLSWIQVRAKKLADRDLYRAVEQIVRRLEGTAVRLWVDDRADLAALFPVAGLHLGQADLPPRAARGIVGEGAWIGLSTHGLEQLIAADADPDVDLIAIGPIFPTASRENPDPVVGLDFVASARAATGKTLVAIGGIDATNLGQVLAAGADSVALIGALCRGELERNAAELVAAANAFEAAR